MRATLVALVAAAYIGLAAAIGPGRLIVNAPTFVETCSPTTIRWYWTGSDADAEVNTVTVSAISLTGLTRRSFTDKLVKRRLPTHGPEKRAGPTTIQIAGAQSIPMDDLTYTWSSVALPSGTYRIGVTIDDVGLTSYSDDFDVTPGDSSTCLAGIASTSASSSDSSTSSSSLTSSSSSSSSPISSTAAPSTTSQGTSDSGATSTASPDTSNADASNSNAASAAQNTAGVFNSNASGTQEEHHSNGGKIAAGILVPVAVIGALLLFFFCRRKRNADESQSRRQAWSEKFGGRVQRSQSTTSSFAGIHRRNASQMSGQEYAMQDASPSREMTEAAAAGGAVGASSGVWGGDVDPQWARFDGENDAHPISPRGMQDIVRRSMDSTAQYQSLDHYPGYATPRHMMESSYPPFVPSQPPRPAPVPQPSNEQSHTSEVMLHRSGSQTSQERFGSNEEVARKASVRRKPVPIVSVIESERRASNPEEKSPFGDENAAYADDAVMPQETSMPTMPPAVARELPQPPSAGQTGNDEHRSSLAPSSFHGPSGRAGGLPLPGRSLTGPRSVTDSDFGSPAIDEQRTDAWKLSVQLGAEQDRGFRVSFPDIRDGAPHAM